MEFEPKAAFDELRTSWGRLQTALAWHDLTECELRRGALLNCTHFLPINPEAEDVRNQYGRFIFLAEQIRRALDAAALPLHVKQDWQRELNLWVRYVNQLRISERFISR